MKASERLRQKRRGQVGGFGLGTLIGIVTFVVMLIILGAMSPVMYDEFTPVTKKHNYANYSVTDDQVKFTSLDTYFPLSYGGQSNQSILANNYFVENSTSGEVYAESGNYSIDLTAGNIKALSGGQIAQNEVVNVTYNYTEWTAPSAPASHTAMINLVFFMFFIGIVVVALRMFLSR